MSPPSTVDAADYVIVGGGTSGLVLASRLSENPSVNVVVLEAGENHLDDPRVYIPAFWPSLMGTELDWQFKSLSQVCAGRFRLSICLLFLLYTNSWAHSRVSESVRSDYLRASFLEAQVALTHKP